MHIVQIADFMEAAMTVTVSSTDFQRNVGAYTDKAMQEPLIITSHGRERLALISIDGCNRFKMLEDREVFLPEDLPEDPLLELEDEIKANEDAGLTPTNYKVTQF